MTIKRVGHGWAGAGGSFSSFRLSVQRGDPKFDVRLSIRTGSYLLRSVRRNDQHAANGRPTPHVRTSL
jgi:hypothetical protein